MRVPKHGENYLKEEWRENLCKSCNHEVDIFFKNAAMFPAKDDLPEASRGYADDRLCWFGTWDWWRCCDHSQSAFLAHGNVEGIGNPLCWNNFFTYKRCCTPSASAKAHAERARDTRE